MCVPAATQAHAQLTPTPTTHTPQPIASDAATPASEVPQVPGIPTWLRGFNGGVTFSGVHDSATGWSTIFTPAVGFSANSLFSTDISIPIYMFRLAESTSPNPKPDAQLIPLRGDVGDMIFGFHFQFNPRGLDYLATVSATAPTGDEIFGLTSGRATFDLTNHFEHNFNHVTPSLELGIGDSSTLANRLVQKNYTSLGPLAHFQIGASVPLWRGISYDLSAYEQLPIGDQKIYTSTTRRHVTTTVVTGHNVTEDNGFTTSLDIPFDGHTTFATYYNRSLRLHDDTVSIGLTYVLRPAPPEPISTDDLFR
ncbi:hypothetical protein [Granulicella rosea]|nr:hypothetical protein [Granulicella rosea]